MSVYLSDTGSNNNEHHNNTNSNSNGIWGVSRRRPRPGFRALRPVSKIFKLESFGKMGDVYSHTSKHRHVKDSSLICSSKLWGSEFLHAFTSWEKGWSTMNLLGVWLIWGVLHLILHTLSRPPVSIPPNLLACLIVGAKRQRSHSSEVGRSDCLQREQYARFPY